MHILIQITNTLNIYSFVLKKEFIIQSHNKLDLKKQTLENDGFITLSNSMIMDEPKSNFG
jgi:hypothetical protein